MDHTPGMRLRSVEGRFHSLVLAVATFLSVLGCSAIETKEARIGSKREWGAAPSFIPTGASDIWLARNIDLECRQWLRFRFEAEDSLGLASAGDSGGSEAVHRLPSTPRWWNPSTRGGLTVRSVNETGWDGRLLLDWKNRMGYFVGC